MGIGFGAVESPANSVRKHRDSDVIGAFASLSSLTVMVGERWLYNTGNWKTSGIITRYGFINSLTANSLAVFHFFALRKKRGMLETYNRFFIKIFRVRILCIRRILRDGLCMWIKPNRCIGWWHTVRIGKIFNNYNEYERRYRIQVLYVGIWNFLCRLGWRHSRYNHTNRYNRNIIFTHIYKRRHKNASIQWPCHGV